MNTKMIGIACGVALVSTVNAEIRRMVTILTGSQEVPAVATTARGCGLFEINTDTNTMTYRIVYAGLSSNELFSHIHGFSAPGANSGVKHNLPNGNLKIGTWTYAEADEASILNGLTYVNVHSANFSSGEIRGQIVDMASWIDGAQEVPANASAGRGVGLFMLDTAANTLRYHIIFGGLGSAEIFSHIHGASNYGVNSGVLHNLPVGSPKVGTWTYPEAQEQALKDGLMYVNIHSSGISTGEIRGQIVPSVNPLDRTQEVPPTNTSTIGCGYCAINRVNNTLGYDVQVDFAGSTELFSHIHGFSAAGANSGVVHNLPLGARKLGSWAYGSEANEEGILDELTYFNVHTNVFSTGEVRGQIRWPIVPPPPCDADFNGDGFLDFFDYDAYVECFETEVCPPGKSADFNGDGFIDFFDYDEFVTAFEGGC
jgi:hypothetical protein